MSNVGKLPLTLTHKRNFTLIYTCTILGANLADNKLMIFLFFPGKHDLIFPSKKDLTLHATSLLRKK